MVGISTLPTLYPLICLFFLAMDVENLATFMSWMSLINSTYPNICSHLPQHLLNPTFAKWWKLSTLPTQKLLHALERQDSPDTASHGRWWHRFKHWHGKYCQGSSVWMLEDDNSALGLDSDQNGLIRTVESHWREAISHQNLRKAVFENTP